MSPIPDYPAYGDIVLDMVPSFAWTYPDTCVPEGYRIEVTTYGGYDFGETQSGGTGDSSTSWAPAIPLEPYTDYEWRVAPINGTDLGPYSPSTRFWTGPICDTSSLVAPELQSPADGSIVTNEYQPLVWNYPDPCVPEGYLVELNTSPTFLGPNLMGPQDVPATARITSAPLVDCTAHWWRITPQNSDGDGPASPTFTFATDFFGTCASPCATSMVPPVKIYPLDNSIILELQPTFEWSYPDPCIPDFFHIETTPAYLPYYEYALTGDTTGPTNDWASPEELLPATKYLWALFAVSGEVEGPSTGPSSFFTGPVCETASLIAPNIIEPPDGVVVTEPLPLLKWEYTDACIPEEFFGELSTDPGFAGPNLFDNTGTPDTRTYPIEELTDCTQYFWHVLARNSGGDGPSTSIHTFYTNFSGDCALPAPLPYAVPSKTIPCYAGDSYQYRNLGNLLKGVGFPIIGINSALSWYALEFNNGICWVERSAVLTIGPWEQIPLRAPEPLPPTKTPTLKPRRSTPTPTQVLGCLVLEKGKKNPSCVAPCPNPCPAGAKCYDTCTP
jgi:hypothetical protein